MPGRVQGVLPRGDGDGRAQGPGDEIIDELEPERRGPTAARWLRRMGGGQPATPAIAIRAAACSETVWLCRRGGDRGRLRSRARIRRDRSKAQAVLRGSRSPRRAIETIFCAVFKLLSTTGDSPSTGARRAVIVGRAVTSDVPVYDRPSPAKHASWVLADGGSASRTSGRPTATFHTARASPTPRHGQRRHHVAGRLSL